MSAYYMKVYVLWTPPDCLNSWSGGLNRSLSSRHCNFLRGSIEPDKMARSRTAGILSAMPMDTSVARVNSLWVSNGYVMTLCHLAIQLPGGEPLLNIGHIIKPKKRRCTVSYSTRGRAAGRQGGWRGRIIIAEGEPNLDKIPTN